MVSGSGREPVGALTSFGSPGQTGLFFSGNMLDGFIIGFDLLFVFLIRRVFSKKMLGFVVVEVFMLIFFYVMYKLFIFLISKKKIHSLM